MKQFLCALWLAGLAGALCGADSAPLSGVHSVYLLPMGGGLDQFLATRLTGAHLFVVVTDPAKAEAVFTDKLGEALQMRLDQLFAPPKPKKTDEAKDGDKDKALKDDTPHPPSSSFGQGKGTIFLVDTKARTVIWSTYEKPKNSTSDEMNRIAGRITDQLKRELGKK
jgi:hypothetical protein